MADHCSIFALTDPLDADLRQSCTHTHDGKCDQCTDLASALSDIEKLLREIPFSCDNDRDEAFYLYQRASLAIHAWKCHQLIAVRQDQARLDALDLLEDGAVLLVNDWAMKFIPQKYRESPSDWFWKRGINFESDVLQALAPRALVSSFKVCNLFNPYMWFTIMTNIFYSHNNLYDKRWLLKR